jgi:tetratricopeptide (TPR) repeat protein
MSPQNNSAASPESNLFFSPWRRHDGLLGFFLLLCTIAAYQPAWHAGFVWDDDNHVTPPALRSVKGLARIWTQLGATQQYYPLVHSIFWGEHRLWGDETAGYHWVNILLHAFSAFLLVRILRQLEIPGAWLAGAFFALHPVEVESVAWVSELKNTSSGFFYLSAALLYLGFDRTRNWRNYVAALGLFLLGLMCKTVIATLPAALLVVFWWQRSKLSWKRDVLPLIPFFIAGAGAGLMTAWVERKFIGAEGAEYSFSIIDRFLIAGRAVCFYLGKIFWPVDLSFMYAHWNVNQATWWQYLFPAAVLLLAGVLIWQRWRGPLAALLFFVGTLFPALGFFNVYPFRYSFVADHFQYLASIGPLTLAAAAISRGAAFLPGRRVLVETMAGASLLLVFGILTWEQCETYANSETLWLATIRLNPKCWMAQYNLGLDYLKDGQVVKAMDRLQTALQIKPDYPEARNNLGLLFLKQGQTIEGIAQFQMALETSPNYAQGHNNLGIGLFQMGRREEAIAEFQKAVDLEPGYAKARFNLGNGFMEAGRVAEGIAQYKKALEIQPDYEEARLNLEKALANNPSQQ